MAVRSLAEISPQKATSNAHAAETSNVDHVHASPFDLDGSGVALGIWDSGDVRDTHEQLTGRVFLEDNVGATNHSTHVGGTMIASGSPDASAMGMSPNGTLHSYDWNSVMAEQATAVTTYGISASNHSWEIDIGYDKDTGAWNGDPDGFGAYRQESHDFDELVVDHDLVIVNSAGNQQDDCDPSGSPCDGVAGSDFRYDNISWNGCAKNILTIGAIDDDTPADLTGFSSCGPTDDGRIKPDLVAEGDSLRSTCVGADDDYCDSSGTSMSAPVVTGGVGLFVQHYRQIYGGDDPRADVVKAVLVNSAQDMGRYGPDFAFGHGLYDALAAAQLVEVGPARIMTGDLADDEEMEWLIAVEPTLTQLRVTGVWTDPPAPATTESGDALINDLDLEVISPSGTTHFPFTGPTASPFDGPATNTAKNAVDNVETTWVENPEPGFWTVKMKSATILGLDSQPFAVVANTAFYLPDEPEIEVSASLIFDDHCPGDVGAEKTATIYNTGGGMLLVHNVELLNGVHFEIAPDPPPPYAILPGSHIDVIVRFLPQTPGNWNDVFTVTSNDIDESVLDFPVHGTGGEPLINATMEAKGWFGHVPLGSYETLEMQIINQGTCDLTVTNLFQSFGSTEFTIGEIIGATAFPFVIFPGEAVSVMMKYEPDDYGADGAIFNIESDDAYSPSIPVEMSGECDEPNISVSGSLDFGEVCVDDFIDLEFNICNTGVSDLEVTSVTLGAPCDDFTIINNPFPATVSHDFCLPVTVRFAPTTIGDHNCTLEIASNDPDSPLVTVPITGTSPPPIINITGSLDFGEVCPGELVEKDLDICNTGLCDLEVSSVAFNPACDDFTIINNPYPAAVSHDFCLPVTIRYTPTGVGYHECTLEILSNDPVNPVVTVIVTGTTLPILIDVAPDVAFPPTVIQDVYACSTEKPFSVTNIGECPMTVTAFEIVQPGMDYSVIQLPTLPATLLPGEELGEGDLRLVFAPYVVMRHSEAEVRVTYVTNDPAMGDTETVTRNLCGEATRTGVRVLVTQFDVPVANVEHLNFYRIHNYGTEEEELAIVTLEHDMPLLSEPANPPCEAFLYHREWGALDDPRVLDPGWYQITAKIDDNGQTKTEIWQFQLESCTFFHDLRMDINY